ncbi:hypothetical protein HK104_008951, partial [Borealophlyctis nickersoniae]
MHHDPASKIPAEHHELWPYARDQLSKIPVVLERLKAWRGVIEVRFESGFGFTVVCFLRIRERENRITGPTLYSGLQELLSFFHTIHTYESNYAREFQRMGRVFEDTRAADVFDGSNELLKPLQQCFQKLAAEHVGCEQFIVESTIKRLGGIRGEIVKKHKHFKTEFDRHIHHITKSRGETVNAISTHEKMSSKRLAAAVGTAAATSLA